MPQLTSPLSTPSGMPAINQAHVGKFAGLHMHFATLADLNTAVGDDSPPSGERGNIVAAGPLWSANQVFTVASEPPGVHRRWFIGASAALSHAKTVVLPSGAAVVLANDTSVVLATAGVPADGLGAVGDLAIDITGNAYYIKTGVSTWGAATDVFPGAATAGLTVVAASGASQSINVAAFGVADITLTANCTLSITGQDAGNSFSLRLVIRQDTAGSRAFVFPAGTKWPDATAPVLTTAANHYDVFDLQTNDGGATWIGSIVGQGYSNLTLIGVDGFTRADSASTLGNAEVGGAWTAHAGTWGITGNKAYKAATNTSCIASINVGAANCDASIVVHTAAGSSSGLVVRATDNGNYIFATPSIFFGFMQLYKVVGGVFTQLGTNGFAAAVNADLTVRIRIVGTVIQVYLNGVLDANLSGDYSASLSGTLLTATRVGMRDDTAAGSGVTFDSLSVSAI